MPYLNMVKTLHDQQINHGDISDENVILSEKFQQLFFIDFETLGSSPYVADSSINKENYYLWHAARLYDLNSVANAINGISNSYCPDISKSDCIVEYFNQLSITLDDVVHQYMENEPNVEWIEKHKNITITTIVDEVEKLHNARAKVNADNMPETRVSPCSFYKSSITHENEEIKSDAPQNKRQKTSP